MITIRIVQQTAQQTPIQKISGLFFEIPNTQHKQLAVINNIATAIPIIWPVLMPEETTLSTTSGGDSGGEGGTSGDGINGNGRSGEGGCGSGGGGISAARDARVWLYHP